jgi:hypothetical protein
LHICLKYGEFVRDHGAIAPLFIVNSLFGITKLGSTERSVPMPSHSGHAPYGLLNEKSLGSISSIVKPETGHANFEEKISRLGIFSSFE